MGLIREWRAEEGGGEEKREAERERRKVAGGLDIEGEKDE